MSHPGYTSRSLGENPPPSMRIGIVVPCEPLGSEPTTSDIRASFLTFLHSQPVRDVLEGLTAFNPDAVWTARDGHGRFNFGAVLDGDTDTAPVAWARLLLPQAEPLSYAYEPRSAVFILHVYLRTHAGRPASAANLASWHDRLTRALGIPSALTAYLTQGLGLATPGGQPAQAGVYLDAPHSITELVDTEGLKSLPGSSSTSWFMGWAISDPNGQEAPVLAREWLAQMCDNTLYVDAYEPVLEALTSPRQEPTETIPKPDEPVKVQDTPPTPTETTLKPDEPVKVQDTPPTPTELAVERLTQALPDPTRRIELSNLVDREIQHLAVRIADTTRHPLGGVPFADQLAAYEEETATSACLLATGVFHGDETHIPLWMRSLRRLISARGPITGGSFNGATEAMRHYPALLCLWAMGLSAILAERENLLARFLLEATWTPIFGEPKPQPAAHCLNPNRIIAAPIAAPDGKHWLYPQSHHIRGASREALGQIEPDDDIYKSTCDRLEYLASLVAMDIDRPNGPPWAGEFIPRSGYFNQDHPELSNFTSGGAFGGDSRRARAAREALNTWIIQHPRF